MFLNFDFAIVWSGLSLLDVPTFGAAHLIAPLFEGVSASTTEAINHT